MHILENASKFPSYFLIGLFCSMRRPIELILFFHYQHFVPTCFYLNIHHQSINVCNVFYKCT